MLKKLHGAQNFSGNADFSNRFPIPTAGFFPPCRNFSVIFPNPILYAGKTPFPSDGRESYGRKNAVKIFL
jgi:hypothetical protein